MANEHILVVEDEPAVARALVFALEDDGFNVAWVKSGEQALERIAGGQVHLMLLDIRLPGINGFDVCRKLRLEGQRLPVLMLTARDEEVDRILGLELGADDYIVKPYSLKEVIARVRAHLRRNYGELAAPPAGGNLRFGAVEIDFERWQVSKDGRELFFTPIEFRLLRHLVTHPNRVCSREELIENVWGYRSDFGSDRTVDVRISHLRNKLEDDPEQPRWIHTVRGVGYKFTI